MRTRTRAAIVAALAAATLALAATALGANTATVAVSAAGTATTLHITVPQATDPIAAITIIVPNGYTANLSQAVNTTIGQTVATALGHDVGLTLPLSGSVTTANPVAPASDPCSPGTHAAIWLLNLSVAGQPVTLTLYVDPTSGALAQLGAYVMKICLPPWDTPMGSPGRAVQGAQLLDASFTVNNIFTAPTTGVNVWNTLFTPYVPLVGQVNLAGTFDARSLVGTPQLTIKATKKNGKYAVGGKLTEGGIALSGVGVTVLRGNSTTRVLKVASASTGPGGAWTSSGKLVGKKAVYFKAHASVGERDATSTGCAQPLPATIAPGGCVSATLGAWAVDSPVAKLMP
ncbi:MAG TPA: hypothetical protein VLW05_00185 [Gaiellaceae bacterium]|nr:hypothetical protein [Gaiellaceae bacterium]